MRSPFDVTASSRGDGTCAIVSMMNPAGTVGAVGPLRASLFWATMPHSAAKIAMAKIGVRRKMRRFTLATFPQFASNSARALVTVPHESIGDLRMGRTIVNVRGSSTSGGTLNLSLWGLYGGVSFDTQRIEDVIKLECLPERRPAATHLRCTPSPTRRESARGSKWSSGFVKFVSSKWRRRSARMMTG